MQNAFIILLTGIHKPPKDQGWEFTYRFSERMAQKPSNLLFRSFLVSNLSESLMVAHFWLAT